MFGRRARRRAWTSRVFRQPPRVLIRRIIATSRLDRADYQYRQRMAVIDAALFTRPDYAELAQLAAAVIHDVKGHP